jgi:hypothetical protein
MVPIGTLKVTGNIGEPMKVITYTFVTDVPDYYAALSGESGDEDNPRTSGNWSSGFQAKFPESQKTAVEKSWRILQKLSGSSSSSTCHMTRKRKKWRTLLLGIPTRRLPDRIKNP